MAKTYFTTTLSGSQLDFVIPFEFLARKFILVTLIGASERRLLTLNVDYRFTTKNTITLNKAWGPSDGYGSIELRRETSASERLVDFADGSILRSYELNVAQIQSLHIAEETREQTSGLVKEYVDIAEDIKDEVVALKGTIEDLITNNDIDSTIRKDLSSINGAGSIGTVTGETQAQFNLRNGSIDPTLYGVLTTNTPQQNTRVWEDKVVPLALATGNPIVFPTPSGTALVTYPFDMFRAHGVRVYGPGFNKVRVTVSCSENPVGVQCVEGTISGIGLESVAGSLEWQRVSLGKNSVLHKCSVSGFTHNSTVPNSWGILLESNSINVKILECAFGAGNTQSDIAITEGSTYVIIDGCYSLVNNLRINFEPNSNTPKVMFNKLLNTVAAELYVSSNDTIVESPHSLIVENCVIGRLYYDGLGLEIISSVVDSFGDGLFAGDYSTGRTFAGKLRGVPVGSELLSDPLLSSVSSKQGVSNWLMRYSTVGPENRTARDPSGGLIVGPNVPGTTLITSEWVPVISSSLCLTIASVLLADGNNRDCVEVEFSTDGGTTAGITARVGMVLTSEIQIRAAIVAVPGGSTHFRINLRNGITNNTQTVMYRGVSCRAVTTLSGGVLSHQNQDVVNLLQRPPAEVSFNTTYDTYQSVNDYLTPVPVGTMIRFAYAPTDVMMAKVVAAPNSVSEKLGTLQLQVRYS